MSETQTDFEQDFEDVAGADDGIPEEGEIVKTPLKFSRLKLLRETRVKLM